MTTTTTATLIIIIINLKRDHSHGSGPFMEDGQGLDKRLGTDPGILVQGKQVEKTRRNVRQPKILNSFGSFPPDSPQHFRDWGHSSRARHPSHPWQEHPYPGRMRGMRLQPIPSDRTGCALLFPSPGFPWWALHILDCPWCCALLNAPWLECLIQSLWISRQGDSLECSCPAAG